MKCENDRIIFESRREIEKLQDVCEIAIACGDCNEEEKEIAKKLSELLDTMSHEHIVVPKRNVTIKELFDLLPFETDVYIYDRSKSEPIFDGQLMYSHGSYKRSEINYIRVGDRKLLIDIG